MKPIQHIHSSVVITYNENRNRWEFTLRGRDRSAESLTLAREAIDKPEPEKTKPFEKIKAWLIPNGYDEPEAVEITGIAESRWYSDLTVWVKMAGGKRSKESAERKLYPSNKKNDAICAEMSANIKAINELREVVSSLLQKLEPLKIEAAE